MAGGENLGARFTLDITNLKAGLAEANRMIRQSESEFVEAAAGMNDWSNSADGLTMRVQSLNRQVDIQKAKIQALINIKDETIAQMQEEGASDDEIAAAVDRVNTQLAKEQRQLDQLNTKVDRATDDLNEYNESQDAAARGSDELADNIDEASDAAENASGGFTVMRGVLADLISNGIQAAANALRSFVGDVLDTGRAFESSMSNVAALSGATGDSLQMLEDTAREYGATTQFSASQAADALGYMALAGWDAEQSADALGGVLNLAAASNMDLAQASDMVTDYLSAFNMTADESAYFADMLSYAQANSNTTAEALGEAYRNCAANLNAAGQDVETVTALLASMANQGLKGSEAGTALNAVMRDMTSHMENGAITIGETSVAVMDANGNYRDMTEILADVEAATEGMGDAERAAALSSTFTSDSLRGLNLIMNDGVDNAAAFEEGLRNSAGSAEEMAGIMTDNLSGDLLQLQSAFEELQLSVYEGANEPLRELVQTVTGSVLPSLTAMINGVRGADAQFGRSLGGLITTGINQIVAFLPRFITLGVSLIQSLIVGIVQSLPQIAATVVSSAGLLIEEIGGVIPDILNECLTVIPLLIQSILNELPNFINNCLTFLMGMVDAIPMLINTLLSSNGIPYIINTIVNAVVTAFPQLLDGALRLFYAIIDAIPTIIQLLIQNLPSIINTIVDSVIGAIPVLLNASIQFLTAIIDAIPTIVNLLIDNLPLIIDTVTSTLIDNLPLVLDAAQQLFFGIIDAIPVIVGEIAANMPQIIDSVETGLSNGISTIKEVGKNLIRGLWNGINDMASWIANKIQGFGEGILDDLRDFFGIASPSKVMADEVGKYLGQGVAVGFDDSMTAAAREMQTALDDAIPSADVAINARVNRGGGSAEDEDTQQQTQTGGNVIINQTNNYSQAHSRFEIYKSKQQTAAAVRAALTGA